MESKVSIELIKKRLTEEIDASGVKYVDLAKQVGILQICLQNIKQPKRCRRLKHLQKFARC